MNKKSCQNFSEENFFLSRKKKKIKSDEVSRGIVQIIINNKWLIHVEENVCVCLPSVLSLRPLFGFIDPFISVFQGFFVLSCVLDQ